MKTAFLIITDKTDLDQICETRATANAEKRDLINMGCTVDIVECPHAVQDAIADLVGEVSIATLRKTVATLQASLESEPHEDYAVHCNEAKACGYEVPSFAEYTGQTSSRTVAESRLALLVENDEIDLY